METSHIFAGNPLDRAERERRDEAWIEAALRDSNSRFLPFYNLDVPLMGSPHSVLCWLTSNQLWSSVPHADPVLLGNVDATAHFAVDLSNYATAIDSIKNDLGWRFENCRTAGGLLTVSETGILAQGRSQIDWHARHGFCSICGSQTVKRRGGQVRQCSACKADHFPRTDPVVITIVGFVETGGIQQGAVEAAFYLRPTEVLLGGGVEADFVEELANVPPPAGAEFELAPIPVHRGYD